MIYTSYFARDSKHPNPEVAYASISVGNPKYPLGYKLIDIAEIKPFGIFGRLHGEEYEKAYRARLDRIGVEAIIRAFKAAQGDHKHLYLMCHEKDATGCHRRMFARWWMEKTGEIIDEVTTEKEENKPEKKSPKEVLTQISFYDMM